MRTNADPDVELALEWQADRFAVVADGPVRLYRLTERKIYVIASPGKLRMCGCNVRLDSVTPTDRDEMNVITNV
jgi:hypothetical protein